MTQLTLRDAKQIVHTDRFPHVIRIEPLFSPSSKCDKDLLIAFGIAFFLFSQGGQSVCGFPADTVADWCQARNVTLGQAASNGKMNLTLFCKTQYGKGSWQPSGTTQCSKVRGGARGIACAVQQTRIVT
jgi:hypothetical protein